MDLSRSRLEDYVASPLFRYRPWVAPNGACPQREFHAASAAHSIRIYRGGNRTGKTVSAVVEALQRLLGFHPYAKPPPVYGWLSALDWKFGVGEVLWPEMKKWLPRGAIRSVAWYRKSEPEIPESIVFANGSRLDFKSAEAKREKYQGAGLDFIGIDEEHPRAIVEECRGRLLDSPGCALWATLTPVRRERWVLDLEREAGTYVVRADMEDAAAAGIIDAKAVREYLDSLPDRQRRVRGRGDFAQLVGLVYPAYDPKLHVVRPRGDWLVDGYGTRVAPWPLPETWAARAAIDFGYSNPTAVPTVRVDPETGEAFLYLCPYASHVRVTRWAPVLDEVLPPLAAPLIADHDAAERAELRAAGRETVPAKKSIVPGLEAVERYLHPNSKTGRPKLRLVVHEDDPPRNDVVGRVDAYKVAWEFEGYRYPEAREGAATPPRDLPVKKDDHACLRGDARVLLSDGRSATIGELAEIGTAEVLAVDPADGALRPRPAGAFLVRTDAELVRVTWEGGAVACTPDHPFLTDRGWRAARELEGSHILMPSDTMYREVPDGSEGHLEDDSRVRREALVPLWAVLPEFVGETEAPPHRRVDARARPTTGEASCPPSQRGSRRQPAGEPRVSNPGRTLKSSHDAGAASRAGRADRQVCGASSPRLASVEGGAGVAQGTRAARLGGGRRTRAATADLSIVRRGLRDVQGRRGGEVLLGDVSGSRQSRRAFGLEEAVRREGPMRGDHARGALQELAGARRGSLPLALRRVLSVRPCGRAPVFNLWVADLHNFIVEGAVTSNCDALRYLVVALEREAGGAPSTPQRPEVKVRVPEEKSEKDRMQDALDNLFV